MEPPCVPTRQEVRIPLRNRGADAPGGQFTRFPVESDGPHTEIWLAVDALDSSNRLTPVQHFLKGASGAALFVNMSTDGQFAIVRIAVNVRAEAGMRNGTKKNCALPAKVTAHLVRPDTMRVVAGGFVTCVLVPKHHRVQRFSSTAHAWDVSRTQQRVCRSLTLDSTPFQTTPPGSPPGSPRKKRRVINFVGGSIGAPSLSKRELDLSRVVPA